jgi:transposase
MRLKITRSKNTQHLSIIKDITKENGARSTKIVENLGSLDSIMSKHSTDNPLDWAKDYVASLNKAEKDGKSKVLIPFDPNKLIDKNIIASYNCGYLFLQHIYYKIGLDKICTKINDKYKNTYDISEVLSRIIYGRIISPSSKSATYEFSKTLLEPISFDKHHMFRVLSTLNKESDFIQAQLYKNTKKVYSRNDKILYYDCTNFFFEIEEADEDGQRKYGVSKENRPNPIVQMGLFMDGDGIPLAFSINDGNTNEQVTLQPLEKQIIKDFEHSKFIVCTDAGLSSKI